MKKKDLTSSPRDRQNILNNRYAIAQIQEHLQLGGLEYYGELVFTKSQVSRLFNVSESTIEKYLSEYELELRGNGYQVLRGKKLNEYKELTSASVDVYGTKITVLSIFSFRAVLNLAMLLAESERAKVIRSRILDIVMDVIAKRSGGCTRFINQRDKDYLPAAYQEYSYRKEFTSALNECLRMGNYKYAAYTNKIYNAIFKENAQEYRRVLKLAEKDNPRESMYAEVLRAIASFENGLAYEMRVMSKKLGRMLEPHELDSLIENAEKNPYLRPILEDARSRMASRDLCFRDALHKKLESYIQTVPESDFDRFLGETSEALESRISDPETLAVFKRLKDR